jgi:redox-sensitive bicupin YhaK (pirin superfamily)
MNPVTQQNSTPRQVARKVEGMPAEDGAGVKLTRLIGQPRLQDLDPILMLDAFGSDDPKAYIAGFPPHPHRGFETVTYMIAGKMRHRDNKGGEGLITTGGVQWMTAGRGIVHSEMPEQSEGLMKGFQLWLNLPAREKMRDPWYRDIPDADIPRIEEEGGVSARLIAGRWGDAKGPAPERATDPFIADVTVPAGAAATVPLPEGHAAFVHVFEGEALIGGDTVRTGELAVLDDGAALHVEGGAAGARLLIVGGRPLREPVAKYGPFVMNSQAEIRQAIDDFRRSAF